MPLRTRLETLLRRPFARYLVIGVSVYVFELAVIILAQLAGASVILAVGLSFWLGLLVSFFLQKLVTFGDRRMQRRILLPQIVAVCLLVLFNFGFTVGVAHLLSSVFPAAVTRTIALAVTTIWNFYLYKTRIFKTDDPIID